MTPTAASDHSPAMRPPAAVRLQSALILREVSDAIDRPRTSLEAFGLGIGLILIEWEPDIALDLPPDGGYATPEHRTYCPYAGAVSDINLDGQLAF